MSQKLPAGELKGEPGAAELAESPDMEPYIRFAMSAIQSQDLKPALDEIAGLPLEKRYVWRVVSALKWAFADYDSLSIAADRESLSSEDKEKIMDLVMVRPYQFCLFLEAFFGDDLMENVMTSAIVSAKASAPMKLGQGDDD